MVITNNHYIKGLLNVCTCKFIAFIFQATEVEETIKRIQAHKGVMGVVIVNHEGLVDFFNVSVEILNLLIILYK